MVQLVPYRRGHLSPGGLFTPLVINPKIPLPPPLFPLPLPQLSSLCHSSLVPYEMIGRRRSTRGCVAGALDLAAPSPFCHALSLTAVPNPASPRSAKLCPIVN